MKRIYLIALLTLTVLVGCKKEQIIVPEKIVDACPHISVLNSDRIYTTVNGFTSFRDVYYMYLIKRGDETFFKKVVIPVDTWITYKVGKTMCEYN